MKDYWIFNTKVGLLANSLESNPCKTPWVKQVFPVPRSPFKSKIVFSSIELPMVLPISCVNSGPLLDKINFSWVVIVHSFLNYLVTKCNIILIIIK